MENVLKESDSYDFVVITEKDSVKLKEIKLNEKFICIKIDISINDHHLFKNRILELIKKSRKSL